jgi:SAM-dependent methyltransferase
LGGYGGYAHPLALLVMRPDDLVELGRESYSRGDMVEHFCDKDLVDSGLNSDELSILDEIPLKRGKILLLGLGGGREAIHLSRLGFEVTGIDFVPEMIEKALKNVASRGLKIEGQVQEVSKLDLPECFYDIIWFASGMYSSVPMKKRRIEMLHKIKKSLRNKGYLVCSFSFNKAYGLASPLREF